MAKSLVTVLVCLASLLISQQAAADYTDVHRKIRIGRALLQTVTSADLAVPLAQSSLNFGTLSFKTEGGKLVQVELNPADVPQKTATSSSAVAVLPTGSNSTAGSSGNATAPDVLVPSVAVTINTTNSTSGAFNNISSSSSGADLTSNSSSSFPNSPSNVTVAGTTTNNNTSTSSLNTSHSAGSQSGPGSSSLLLLESGLLLQSPHPGSSASSPKQQQQPALDSPGNATVPHMNSTSFESSGSSATYNSSVMSLVPAQHNYNLANTSQAPNSVLGLPLEPVQTDSRMASWVVCGWAVSNFSSNTMLSDATRTSIQKMITQYFTGMAPGQVRPGFRG
jgi:hypothetical protein